MDLNHSCRPGLWYVCLLTVLCLATPKLEAQYFGQNKVRYETFDWKVLETEHFDIYYYEREREAAVEAGRMAERWYARLSEVLEHNLPPEQPIVFYASHPAFRQTTVYPGQIGTTTGGFTEALRRRVVLPFAAPLAETDHVLGHELIHAFQYDITKQDDLPGVGFQAPGAVRLPLWFIEGMAEYLSVGPVDALTAMWLRDAVKRDELPTIDDLYNPEYFPYRWGHAFWAYVAGRYGDQVVAQMLKSAGRAGSAEGAINRVLKTTPEALTEDWHRAILDEYEPILKDSLPATEQAKQLIDSEEAGELNVSPALSPDGKHVIFFSEKALFAINIYLADAETGEIIRKITEATLDPHLESLQFVNSAGAWAADGQRFVFSSISQGQPQLSIYDMQQEEVTRDLTFPQLGEIFNPTWSPDGRYIAFSAIEGGFTDLYIYDLEKEDLRQITNDRFSELQPSWSPDGQRIAFVTDRFTSDLSALALGEYRLALLDPATGQIEQVQAFDRGKHINPQWGPSSDSLYFISDQSGIPNIYRLDIGGQRLSQVTDLQTGASGISKLSPALSAATKNSKIVFSVFNEGNYKIFSIDSGTRLAGTTPVDSPQDRPAVLPPREAPSGAVFSMLQSAQAGLRPSTGFDTSEYKASLSLDYIAPPNISLGTSNFGTFIGGGTALYFSDILGQHNLMTAFQAVGTTGNFLNNTTAIVGYQNQTKRWNWGGIGGQVPYVTGGYRRFLAEVEGETAVVEQNVRFWQINREAAATIAYPFNRAQRLEFAGGYRNLDFATETRTRAFSTATGRLILDEEQDVPSPETINMGTASTALVYDTSIFGGTSPILGRRYRFELGGVGGGLNYYSALADFRQYLRVAKRLTVAGRFLHFGRYGADAEDPRMQDMYIGYPALVRGYTFGSFEPRECDIGPNQTGSCQVFEQLLGSRMAVANIELRIPILGFFGVIPSSGVPPVETAIFFDAGSAWTKSRTTAFFGGDRSPVTSHGASLRFNIFGFAVGQLSYVHPNDRPLKSWHWEFSLIPGF